VLEAVRDEERLGALRQQHILDTESEPAFDRITRLAADILDTESAIVNFVGEDRQWFKSAVGFEEKETGLEDAFCVYTIEEGERMVVEDAAEDDRFKNNPYVTEQGVRFYAGVSLRVETGHQIGTLCVLDTEPRSPTDAQLRQLSDLAAVIEDELRLRRETARRQTAERQQEMQSTLFESIATGTGTEEVLDELCHQTEQLVSGARASVLRLEGGRLRHVASPSLPSQHVETMDGLEVGPSAGTCGTAAYEGESVITEDLNSDPRWEGDRSAVEGVKAQSCWAVPIRGQQGDVLGTFALYGLEPRGPSEQEKALLHRMAHVAGVALGRDRREQALRESEERLRIAIEGGGIGTWNWDVDTGRVEFNRHWAEMLGYSQEELDSHFTTWENLVHPEDLSRAMDMLERYVSGETETYAPEIRMKTSDGEWKWIQTIGKVIDRGKDGSVSRVAGVHLDIHDRKQARRDLERYRTYTGRMLDAIDDVFFAIDDQARIRRWNASVPEVTGYSDDEIEEMSAFDFVPDSEKERIAVEIGNGFTNGHAQVEVPLLRKDGTRVPYEFVANLVQHPEEGLRVVGVGRDITERKKAERQLREERNFLDRILETSPVAIAVLNEDGEFIEASSRTESILGLEKQELKARTYKDPEWRICGPDGESLSDGDHPFAQVVATGEPIYDFEHTIEWPDGTQRLLSVSGAPLHSADGKLEGAVFHMDDITEEREAQRTLERQNDLFTKAQDIADVGALEYDVRSGETIVTEQVNHILGLEPDAAAGPEQTIGFFHPDDQSTLQDAFRRAIREGISYDLELRLTTGNENHRNEDHRWVRTRGEPQWENGEIARIRGTMQDITERRRQQQQLRERQQKVEVLYEATSQLLRAESGDEVADLLVTIIGDTLGYSGTTIRFVEDGRLAASRVPDAVRDSMPDRPAYPLGGDTPAAEAYRTGETQVFEDLSASRPELGRGEIRGTAYVPIAEHGLISVGSFEVGGIAPFDLRLIEVLGGYATLVLDRLGRVESLRKAKDAAEEADRIKTALLSNMNHELRTPLTSILTFAELIDQNPGAADQFTGRILGGARRLLYTLNTVMEFAELEGKVHVDQHPAVEERCQLDGTVRSVAGDYREQAQQNGIDLEVEVSKEGPVRLDSHLVERVLTHLVDNSVKFTEEGTISVSVTAGADAVVLQVDDTGVGIDPDFLPRVFDEFAQASTGLSRRYEGNGLGLTVAKRLVDRAGGDIEIESVAEEGTWVTVRLPTGG
jgi:PAS domain S-box-containing protein